MTSVSVRVPVRTIKLNDGSRTQVPDPTKRLNKPSKQLDAVSSSRPQKRASERFLPSLILPKYLSVKRPTPPINDLKSKLTSLYEECDAKALVLRAKDLECHELLENYACSPERIKRILLPVIAEGAIASKKIGRKKMRLLYLDALNFKDNKIALSLFLFLHAFEGERGHGIQSLAVSDAQFALNSFNEDLISNLKKIYPKTMINAEIASGRLNGH